MTDHDSYFLFLMQHRHNNKPMFDNACGVCRLGPCLCHRMQVYGPPRPTADERAIPMKDNHTYPQYRGDTSKLLPSTVAWLKEMLQTVNDGHIRRGEPIEVWFNSKGDLI